jgi:hypothetical protein
VLEYRNPVLIAGAEITLVAILTLLAIVVLSRRRREPIR